MRPYFLLMIESELNLRLAIFSHLISTTRTVNSALYYLYDKLL